MREEMKTRSRLFLAQTALLMLCMTAGACAALSDHAVTHADITVALPSDWVDQSRGRLEGLNVGSKWGDGYVIVERAPGQSEKTLKLWRQSVRAEPHSLAEDQISEYLGLPGKGYRFTARHPDGEMYSQITVFFPSGALEGLYIETGNVSARRKVAKQIEEVVRSIRRTGQKP